MLRLLAIVTTSLAVLTACGGGSRKEPSKEVKESPAKEAAAAKDDDKEKDGDVTVSGDFKTFAFSLGNNPLSSKTVDRKKAQDLAEGLAGSLKNPQFKDRKELVALMAARRFAGAGLNDVVNIAIKLVTIEIKKDVKKEMPEIAKLELVLAAIRARKLSFAEFYLPELRDSKNKSVKAAAFTAEGMIALLDGRLPEALYSWNEALKVESDYEPALLNIGFTAMKFGDFATARKRLSARGGDYTVATALISADRLTGNAAKADETCKELIAKHHDYKPLIYNCALNQYQGIGNLEQAEKMLKDMTKVKTDGGIYDEKAERLLMRIEDDRAARKEKREKAVDKKEATDKAAEKKAGSEAPKAGAKPEEPKPEEKKPGT